MRASPCAAASSHRSSTFHSIPSDLRELLHAHRTAPKRVLRTLQQQCLSLQATQHQRSPHLLISSSHDAQPIVSTQTQRSLSQLHDARALSATCRTRFRLPETWLLRQPCSYVMELMVSALRAAAQSAAGSTELCDGRLGGTWMRGCQAYDTQPATQLSRCSWALLTHWGAATHTAGATAASPIVLLQETSGDERSRSC